MSHFPSIAVVGNNYRDAQEKAYFSAIQPGDTLRLEREPENQYDGYAIKVLSPDGLHLGYIASSSAAFIAVEMDENPGTPLIATALNHIQADRAVHLMVDVSPFEEEPDDDDFSDE